MLPRRLATHFRPSVTARPALTVSFPVGPAHPNTARAGDQYVTLPPLKKDAYARLPGQVGLFPDARRWAYSGSGLTVNPNAANQDATSSDRRHVRREARGWILALFRISSPMTATTSTPSTRLKPTPNYPDSAVAPQGPFRWLDPRRREDGQRHQRRPGHRIRFGHSLRRAQPCRRRQGCRTDLRAPGHRGFNTLQNNNTAISTTRTTRSRSGSRRWQHRQRMGCLREEGVRTDPRPDANIKIWQKENDSTPVASNTAGSIARVRFPRDCRRTLHFFPSNHPKLETNMSAHHQCVAARTVATAAPGRPPKPGLLDRIADHFRRYWRLWILTAPALFFVGLFAYVPMWGNRSLPSVNSTRPRVDRRQVRRIQLFQRVLP